MGFIFPLGLFLLINRYTLIFFAFTGDWLWRRPGLEDKRWNLLNNKQVSSKFSILFTLILQYSTLRSCLFPEKKPMSLNCCPLPSGWWRSSTESAPAPAPLSNATNALSTRWSASGPTFSNYLYNTFHNILSLHIFLLNNNHNFIRILFKFYSMFHVLCSFSFQVGPWSGSVHFNNHLWTISFHFYIILLDYNFLYCLVIFHQSSNISCWTLTGSMPWFGSWSEP